MSHFHIYAKEKLGYTDEDLKSHSDLRTGKGDRKFNNQELDILHTVWADAVEHVFHLMKNPTDFEFNDFIELLKNKKYEKQFLLDRINFFNTGDDTFYTLIDSEYPILLLRDSFNKEKIIKGLMLSNKQCEEIKKHI